MREIHSTINIQSLWQMQTWGNHIQSTECHSELCQVDNDFLHNNQWNGLHSNERDQIYVWIYVRWDTTERAEDTGSTTRERERERERDRERDSLNLSKQLYLNVKVQREGKEEQEQIFVDISIPQTSPEPIQILSRHFLSRIRTLPRHSIRIIFS